MLQTSLERVFEELEPDPSLRTEIECLPFHFRKVYSISVIIGFLAKASVQCIPCHVGYSSFSDMI